MHAPEAGAADARGSDRLSVLRRSAVARHVASGPGRALLGERGGATSRARGESSRAGPSWARTRVLGSRPVGGGASFASGGRGPGATRRACRCADLGPARGRTGVLGQRAADLRSSVARAAALRGDRPPPAAPKGCRGTQSPSPRRLIALGCAGIASAAMFGPCVAEPNPEETTEKPCRGCMRN